MEPMTWVAIGMLVVSLVISVALAPKQTMPEPASFKDMKVPQVNEGTPQAVHFGTVWTEDWTVLWMGNFSTAPVKASSVGKK